MNTFIVNQGKRRRTTVQAAYFTVSGTSVTFHARPSSGLAPLTVLGATGVSQPRRFDPNAIPART